MNIGRVAREFRCRFKDEPILIQVKIISWFVNSIDLTPSETDEFYATLGVEEKYSDMGYPIITVKNDQIT